MKLTAFLVMLFISVNLVGQTTSQRKTVEGTTTDATTGEPLAGVSVVEEKRTSNGTVTNASGKFALQVVNAKSRLIISYVGYVVQTVPSDATSFDIKLATDPNSNMKAVVVVGYGTQKRVNLTGSVASVSTKDITVAPVSNITNTLAGRLPGLIAKQNTGAPGSDAAQLSIRGYGPALIIVDGVEQNFYNLDPNEIETVTILKDASAAIFGARAGNGVILVTTKRGKSGSKPVIRVNGAYTWQGLTKYPKPVNAGQYAEIMREAQLNNGVASPRFSENDVKEIKAGTSPVYTNTDWWEETMNDWSPLQQYNLSLSGGSPSIRYYAYLGYMNQVGMYKSGDNSYSRYNVRANLDADITKNLTMTLDMVGIMEKTKNPARNNNTNLFQDFFDAEPIYRANFPDQTKIPVAGSTANTNPVAQTTRSLSGYRDADGSTLRGSLSFRYNIPAVPGLSLKAFANYMQVSNDRKAWVKQYYIHSYNSVANTYTQVGPNGNTTLDEDFDKTNVLTTQFSANYNRKIGDDHEVSGLLLYEGITSDFKYMSAHRENYISTAVDYQFAGGTAGQRTGGYAIQDGRASYVGRVNYSYKAKYLLEGTLRYDGSPKFEEGNRWGWFPSISAGWRMSEENFIRDNITWMENLKLRASFSNTGYDGTGAFQYLTGYQFSDPYIINGVAQNGLVTTGLANPNITWEKLTNYNIGIDMTALRGKIYLTADVFYRKRDGILATRATSLPLSFGATLPAENLNSQNTRGFEFLLGTRGSIGDFQYDISGNLTWARTKWDYYDEPKYTNPDDIRRLKQSGQWADRVFAYKSDGLFTSQEEINKLGYNQDLRPLPNSTLRPGDIKYVDINNDGKIDLNDFVEIGTNDNPRIMYGMNFNFKFKDFDLSMLWQGASGRNVQIIYDIPNARTPVEILYNERWTPENNNKDGLLPRVTFGTNANNSKISDFWVRKGDYLRLRALSFGYNLPKRLLTKFKMQELRVYIAGTNLVTFSELSDKYDIDPEAPSSFTSKLYYPQQKTVSVGLNLSF